MKDNTSKLLGLEDVIVKNVAEDAADIGRSEGICANKSTDSGVVISAVQVVQPRITWRSVGIMV